MNEDGHSCALDGERQGAEDGGRKSLAEKFHRSRQLARYTMRFFPLTTTSWLISIRRSRRLRINQRHLCQLHVDRETQPPVELIEQRGFPA